MFKTNNYFKKFLISIGFILFALPVLAENCILIKNFDKTIEEKKLNIIRLMKTESKFNDVKSYIQETYINVDEGTLIIFAYTNLDPCVSNVFETEKSFFNSKALKIIEEGLKKSETTKDR